MSHEGDIKKIRQRLHAKKRAKERYGLDLTTRDLKEIASLITAKPRKAARQLRVASPRISLWEVVYKEVTLPVAWDWKSATVASILPPRALEKYRRPEDLTCKDCGAACGTAKELRKHRKRLHKNPEVCV